MDIVIANNALGLLAAEISSDQASLELQPGHGTRFPAVDEGVQFAKATLSDRFNTRIEIVHITKHESGSDVFTILRAQEETEARAFYAGDRFEIRPTAGAFNSILEQSRADAEAAEADRIQTGEDRTATGEDRVQTGEDRAATGEDRVQTGEDRAATGEDRTQTGLDRTAAENAASAALVSSEEAEASAERAESLASTGIGAESLSTLEIGTGEKSLTIDTGKSFLPGDYVRISDKADFSRWMYGPVLSYDSDTGNMTVDVQEVNGSGTYSEWFVRYKGIKLGEMAEKDFATEQEAIDAEATDKGMSPYTSRKALTSFVQATTDQVIGIAMIQEGGGAGSWARIDRDGNFLVNSAFDFGGRYYRYHPVYSAIAEQMIDGQYMIKIPKFFVKNGTGPAGSDADGKPCWWISPDDESGFHRHPAFMDMGSPIDQFWWGKYKARSSGGKLLSLPGGNPLVDTHVQGFRDLAEARNVGGVDGFMLTSFHQLTAIQRLMLIEMGTPDAQAVIGDGHVDGSSAVSVEHETYEKGIAWRGLFGLWGNVTQWMDGWLQNSAGNIELWDRDGNRTWVDTGIATSHKARSFRYPVNTLQATGEGFDFNDTFFPSGTDGSYSGGSFADGWYGNTGERAYRHGGSWNSGSDAGPFFIHSSNAPSHTHATTGGRLGKV